MSSIGRVVDLIADDVSGEGVDTLRGRQEFDFTAVESDGVEGVGSAPVRGKDESVRVGAERVREIVERVVDARRIGQLEDAGIRLIIAML